MPTKPKDARISQDFELPLEQRQLHAKCLHRTGIISEFAKADIEQSLDNRFEQIVERYPGRIAVKTSKQSVTYAELNYMADCVASAIAAQQGHRSGPVGILFNSGYELLAAMLGVWKAGNTVALLDPVFPSARIAAMLEESEANLVIADKQNTSLALDAVPMHRLLQFESIERSASAQSRRGQIAPKAFACFVYTSGSTGQPKAVILSHRNMLHQTRLFTNAYHLCAHDRIALLTSGTSNTVHTALLALLNGATLLPFDVRQEGITRISDWLMREEISICLLSSPLFRSFCQTLTGKERFSELRLLRLRSEAVYKSDFELYKKHFPRHCLLASGLASTETGLSRNCFFDHASVIAADEVPVGYAVEDKEIKLLDAEGRQVGFNEIGEIVVRSQYLSPGYLGRADLTEAKFRADPEGAENRLYFTGDLGLMLPDGCLIHKGRKDFRVKIRGYGVEVAEVEKALRAHEAVRDAVVVGRHNKSAETQLVAYFTVAQQRAPSASDLREFLSSSLPAYMIPSVFVRLDTLPLTPQGKIARRALPDPEQTRPELSIAYVAPHSDMELQLARIWSSVLSLDRVGIHDNFFDLGGHSLAATRVISRVVQAFQLELPVRSLFDAPTIAEMAVIIHQIRSERASDAELAQMLRDVETITEEEAQRHEVKLTSVAPHQSRNTR